MPVRPAAAPRRGASRGWGQNRARRRPRGTPERSTPGRPPARAPWRGAARDLGATGSQLPPYGRSPPFNVLSVTEDQAWLRPSPGLWRMRRAEGGTFHAGLGAFFRLLLV